MSDRSVRDGGSDHQRRSRDADRSPRRTRAQAGLAASAARAGAAPRSPSPQRIPSASSDSCCTGPIPMARRSPSPACHRCHPRGGSCALGTRLADAQRPLPHERRAPQSTNASPNFSVGRRPPRPPPRCLELVYRLDVHECLPLVRTADVRGPPSRRPRHPLPAGTRGRGGNPSRDVHPSAGQRTLPVARRRRVRHPRLPRGPWPRTVRAGQITRSGASPTLGSRAGDHRVRSARAERPRDRRSAGPEPTHRASARGEHSPKLGRTSRTAAVAEAARLGLL